MRKKLKFGVFIDRPFIKKWQFECIEKLLAEQHCELVVFYLNQPEQVGTKKMSGFVYRIINKMLQNKGPLQEVSIRSEFQSTPITLLNTFKKKYTTFIEEKHLTVIKEQGLDFILRFGFGILKGEILKIPTYGVWSFHHGNPYEYRGGPAGFWEIYYGNHRTGAILQKLTNQLDKGEVLKQGTFKTSLHSYRENFYQLLNKTTSWPSIVVKQIVLNQKFNPEKINSKAEIYKAPSNLKATLFCLIILKNKLRLYKNFLFNTTFWKIGVVEQTTKEIFEDGIKAPKWLTSPKSFNYWADPFPLNKDKLLVEEFDYKNFKGCIKMLSADGSIENFIQSSNHLSYPFVAHYSAQTFVIPESLSSNKVIAYKLVDGAKKEIPLLNRAIADPTLFYYQNIWWLFGTSKTAANEELHLFYSDTIDGSYHPHPLNPIIQDVDHARPAGNLFVLNGEIFRPSQQCAKSYGEAINIQKITTLTKKDYQEEFYKKITCPNYEGIHTINAWGDKTVIDVKYYQFSWVHFKNQILKKLNMKQIDF